MLLLNQVKKSRRWNDAVTYIVIIYNSPLDDQRLVGAAPLWMQQQQKQQQQTSQAADDRLRCFLITIHYSRQRAPRIKELLFMSVFGLIPGVFQDKELLFSSSERTIIWFMVYLSGVRVGLELCFGWSAPCWMSLVGADPRGIVGICYSIERATNHVNEKSPKWNQADIRRHNSQNQTVHEKSNTLCRNVPPSFFCTGYFPSQGSQGSVGGPCDPGLEGLKRAKNATRKKPVRKGTLTFCASQQFIAGPRRNRSLRTLMNSVIN